jgi:hypothetical protein
LSKGCVEGRKAPNLSHSLGCRRMKARAVGVSACRPTVASPPLWTFETPHPWL